MENDFDITKVLVGAGADTGKKDKVYDGTPLDWAEYMQRERLGRRRRKGTGGLRNIFGSARGERHAAAQRHVRAKVFKMNTFL